MAKGVWKWDWLMDLAKHLREAPKVLALIYVAMVVCEYCQDYLARAAPNPISPFNLALLLTLFAFLVIVLFTIQILLRKVHAKKASGRRASP